MSEVALIKDVVFVKDAENEPHPMSYLDFSSLKTAVFGSLKFLSMAFSGPTEMTEKKRKEDLERRTIYAIKIEYPDKSEKLYYYKNDRDSKVVECINDAAKKGFSTKDSYISLFINHKIEKLILSKL